MYVLIGAVYTIACSCLCLEKLSKDTQYSYEAYLVPNFPNILVQVL